VNGAWALPSGDVAAACFERCLDLNGGSLGNNPPDVLDFCSAHARPAVNATRVFAGACADGQPLPDFADPRRRPAPVVWTNLNGVATGGAEGNTLVRTAPETPDADGFNAGASSVAIIRRGDAYVEFTAAELGKAKLLGVSSGEADGDPTKDDVDFGMRLTVLGNILISEGGALVEKAPGDPVWGTYVAGSRVRVRIKERADGDAEITYEQVLGPCDPDTYCQSMPLRSPSGPAAYPFRIDTSLKEVGAALTDVRVVHIQ
jgi:hypothetical protein